MSTVGYDGAMAAQVIQSPAVDEVKPMNATHRCDRCGAQAYVRAKLSSGELLFCAHHGREHMPKLSAAGAEITDESERLYNEAALMKQATTEV